MKIIRSLCICTIVIAIMLLLIACGYEGNDLDTGIKDTTTTESTKSVTDKPETDKPVTTITSETVATTKALTTAVTNNSLDNRSNNKDTDYCGNNRIRQRRV